VARGAEALEQARISETKASIAAISDEVEPPHRPSASLGSARPPARAEGNGRSPLTAQSTIAAMSSAIVDQRAQLDAREAEINTEIAALREEKKELGARKALYTLVPKAAA
jgi:hypothetical protein